MLLLGLPSVAGADVYINEFLASNNGGILDEDGDSSDWIELYNSGASAVSLEGWSLSDNSAVPDKWLFPSVSINPGQYLVVFASSKDRALTIGELHTNFNLGQNGEYLGFFTPSRTPVPGSVFDPQYPAQKTDYSMGNPPGGPGSFVYFAAPTPGSANTGTTYAGFVSAPAFSAERKIATSSFFLTLSCATIGATIRYTTNGSAPTVSSTAYSSSIYISGTTVLRAAAFKSGWLESPSVTNTYLFLNDVITQSPTGAAPGPGWPTSDVNEQLIDYGMDPDVVNDARYSALMTTALEAVPTFSIVTNLEHLFDPATGIYVNAKGDGYAWERPASVELIYPDGTQGFQINAGLRIRGGYSRNAWNPKHAFRLFFRSEYGASKLRYPMFGEEGAGEFDNLDLRTSQNYSWSFYGDNRNTMNRDVFSRDAQRDMGHAYTRSRYYHLYLNGVYWGLFQTQERSEASFAETYFGGIKEDYDVVKVDTAGYNTVATDGDTAAWQRLWQAATDGFDTDAAYYRIQGLNPNGTPNLSYEVQLDVDNLIDYMIIIYYGGNKDAPISNFLGNNSPNNFYGIRNRFGREGWRFMQHDAEHTMLLNDLQIDRTGPFPAGVTFNKFNPQWLHQQLMVHPEYRMRFADRVHRHFFNGGVLMPDQATVSFMARANEINMAIIGESARWGDVQIHPPRNKDDHWLPRISNIVNNYFPVRTAIVLDQFLQKQWYPSVQAPAFNQHGGPIIAGFSLTISAPTGTIYYTLDGTDPRLPATPGPTAETTLLTGPAAKKVLVPSAPAALYTGTGAFNVTMYRANTSLANISTDALKVINSTEYQNSVTRAAPSVINYLNTGAAGHYGGDAPFPNTVIGDNADNFVLVATAHVNIPAAGNWTFGVSSDDGFRLRLTSGATKFESLYDNPRSANDTLAIFNIPAAGIYQLELIFFEAGGGSELELFAAQGGYNSFTATAFDLVGNTASGGLALVTHWTDPAFPDGTWTSGTGGAGYENGSGYESYIGIDVRVMSGQQRSCLMRIPFTLNAGGLDGQTGMTLGVQYDDGFAAFLNGVQIAYAKAAAPLAWNALATSNHADADAIVFQNFDVSEYRHLLREGANVLSIHGLNVSTTSSDFLSNAELRLTESSSVPGAVSPGALAYTGPVTLNQTTHVMARVLSAGQWSALDEATFTAGEIGNSLRISEIMYNPALGGAEFIELTNIGAQPIDISGVYFSDGISFTFPANTVLQPGDRIVLVRSEDVAAFQALYPGVQITGIYSGALSNGGETVALSAPGGALLDSVTYDDASPWPSAADGLGFSLVLLDAGGNPNDAASWRSSTNVNGSPGTYVAPPNIPQVRINEALTHTDLPQVDSIEIYNPTGATADIRGWYVTDDRRTPKKARIPNRSEYILQAGGYAVITENDFGFNPGAGLPGFFLSSHGNEGAYIYSAGASTNLTGYSHGYQFGAAENGVSFGRYVSSDGVAHFSAEIGVTLGAANTGPRVGPIVISEISYNPTSGAEYIELTNISGADVPLWDNAPGGNPNNTYHINGIGYAFPPGVTLPAGARLLIVNSATPQAYGTPYGPFGGEAVLDNAGESITIEWPDTPDQGFLPYIAMDRVTYAPTAPWPGANGNGLVLRRTVLGAFGNDPANWYAGGRTYVPNPPAGYGGAAVWLDFAFTGTERGDFNNPCNTLDDALYAVTAGGTIIVKTNSAVTSTAWTGRLDTPVTLDASPIGSIRIGLTSKSLKSTLGPAKSAGAATLAAFLRALSFPATVAAAIGGADTEAAEADDAAALFEPVIPFTQDEYGRYKAQADSALAVRLRNAGGIDLDSLWQSLSPEDLAPTVQWQQAGGSGGGDIWVIFNPEGTWYLDDTLTASVGAVSATGEAVSATHTFQVESPGDYDARTAAPPGTLWQPNFEGDASESKTATLTYAGSAPALEQGADAPLAITPEQVYPTPQRVWIPIPQDMDPNDAQLYYYHPNAPNQGWHPAEQVEGWLVPDSYLYLDAEGTVYLGFLVRHAGIVQLGTSSD